MKVLGILSFRERSSDAVSTASKKRRLQLIVVPLVIAGKPILETRCPFHYVKLDYDRQLWVQIVDFKCIYSPLFCFFDPDKKPRYEEEVLLLSSVKQYRYWMVPPHMYLKCRKGIPMTKESCYTFFSSEDNDHLMNVQGAAAAAGDEIYVPFLFPENDLAGVILPELAFPDNVVNVPLGRINEEEMNVEAARREALIDAGEEDVDDHEDD